MTIKEELIKYRDGIKPDEALLSRILEAIPDRVPAEIPRSNFLTRLQIGFVTIGTVAVHAIGYIKHFHWHRKPRF